MDNIVVQNFVTSLKKMQRKEPPSDLIFGEVTSISPLKVNIGNNIIISEQMLFLGQNCRPHKVTIPHSHLVNAIESEKSKAIITSSISAGTATDTQQTTGTYDVKTQEITRNDEKGIDERQLKTETKSQIDLGGASLSMAINVAGSTVSTSVTGTAEQIPVTGTGTGAISNTTDLSTFTVSDNGHLHIVPEHSTQDVHFPDTDYEEFVTIEIYPRLKVGDKVLMFAFNNYQMYYIAERIEEK